MRRRQNYHYLLLHQQRPWHRSLHAVYTPCRGRMGGPGHLSETQDPEFNYNWPSSWGDEAAALLPHFLHERQLSDWGYNGQ